MANFVCWYVARMGKNSGARQEHVAARCRDGANEYASLVHKLLISVTMTKEIESICSSCTV